MYWWPLVVSLVPPYLNSISRVPDSKVHGANMGPIWGRQDPGGPHVGPMNFGIWGDAGRPFVSVIIL